MKSTRPTSAIEPLEARIAPANTGLVHNPGDIGFAYETSYTGVGSSVSGVGDMNGDGFEDFAVGVNGDDAKFVVFGKATGFPSTLNLAELDGVSGFEMKGGATAAAAGDVNGDGFDDLLVAARTDPGAGYVLFGRAGGFSPQLDVTAVAGSDGFKIESEPLFTTFGQPLAAAVRTAGDVNGDGFDDVWIGNVGATAAGTSFVVFGKRNGFGAVINTADLDGGNGFALRDGGAGVSLGIGGDLNGDGRDDLFINSKGKGYVAFGKETGFGATLELSSLDGTNGFAIDQPSVYPAELNGGGDFNGDGFDDLVVASGGSAHVIFGSAGGFGARFNVSNLNGSNGFQLTGTGGNTVVTLDFNGDHRSDLLFRRDYYGGYGSAVLYGKADGLGATVSLIGLDSTLGFDIDSQAAMDGADVNGDGFDDLLIGNRVVFGKAIGSTPGFSATLKLSGLDGSNGFNLGHTLPDAHVGFSVSNAGDVNGDGVSDILVGAPGSGPTGAGASYLVFGGSDPYYLGSLTGTNGFKITGSSSGSSLGFSVSGAGDVNGDGFADLLVGAPGAGSGASYLIFGKASGFSGTFDVGTLDGSNGFKLEGAAGGDQSGFAVSAAGDVNGDGFADVMVGAPFSDSNGTDSGAAYVVFGRANGFAATIALDSLDGMTGFRLQGEAAGDHFGTALGKAGDMNGDGLGDLVIGAPDGAARHGATYVVFGRGGAANPVLNVSTLDGTNGLKITGEASGDRFGAAVSGAGDLNGDGFADVLVGAPLADANAANSGAAYVLFGKAGAFDASVSASTLAGGRGFRVAGAAAGDHFGAGVSGGGDLNADALADVAISAPLADATSVGTDIGAVYILFGNEVTGNPPLVLNALNGKDGYKLKGAPAGSAVDASGDLNNDHIGDVLMSKDFPPHPTYHDTASVVFGESANLGLTISKNGKTAKFTETDGDLVTVTVNKGVLLPEQFVLIGDGAGGSTLQSLDFSSSSFGNLNLTITAKPGPTGGDGFVRLGFLDASSSYYFKSFQNIRIDGDLGRIRGSYIKSLTVQSFGMNHSAEEAADSSLASEVGFIDTFVVKGDFRDTTLEAGSIGKMTVGGSLDRVLLHFNSSYYNPVVLKSLLVGGSVRDSQIIADANDGSYFRGVQIGTVSVGGDWSASDLVAGMRSNDGYFGNGNDTVIPKVSSEYYPEIVSKIASIAIKGQVVGSLATGDHFGIIAEKIGKIIVGKKALPLTTSADSLALGATDDFWMRDFVQS